MQKLQMSSLGSLWNGCSRGPTSILVPEPVPLRSLPSAHPRTPLPSHQCRGQLCRFPSLFGLSLPQGHVDPPRLPQDASCSHSEDAPLTPLQGSRGRSRPVSQAHVFLSDFFKLGVCVLKGNRVLAMDAGTTLQGFRPPSRPLTVATMTKYCYAHLTVTKNPRKKQPYNTRGGTGRTTEGKCHIPHLEGAAADPATEAGLGDAAQVLAPGRPHVRAQSTPAGNSTQHSGRGTREGPASPSTGHAQLTSSSTRARLWALQL